MKFNKRKIEKIFAILIAVILLVSIYLNTYLLIKYNVLPFKFLLLYIFLVGLIPLAFIFFTVFKRPKLVVRIILYFLEFLYLIILFITFSYLNHTFNFLDNFTNGYDYETKNYYVLTKKDSSYEKITDIDNKKIAYVKNLDASIDKAVEELDKVVKLNHEEYEGYVELFDHLNNGEIDSLLINDGFYKMLSEEENPITSNSKILYKFSIKEKIEKIGNEVDVTKEVFTIYISGIGSYGNITDQGLSDVNMLLSINPQNYEILMLNIPRDYYIPLNGKNAKDKLTHSGVYGVQTSLKTVEDLLDIKINYYIKVNYGALIGLVDALEGVNVYSEYDFYSAEFNYKFNKGYNEVNGKQALDFVRTRKAFLGGDRVRGENQQAMIQAIINKATSPVILLKYDDILKSLESSFTTNISTDSIMNLIKLQLDKMPNWNIKTMALDGSDALEFTYTYPSQQLYVMIPNEDTIKEAKEALKRMNE